VLASGYLQVNFSNLLYFPLQHTLIHFYSHFSYNPTWIKWERDMQSALKEEEWRHLIDEAEVDGMELKNG
jgi:hypothetical protein